MGAASPAHAQLQIRFSADPKYGTILGNQLLWADAGHRYLVMQSIDTKGFLRVDTQGTHTVELHMAIGYNCNLDTNDFLPSDSGMYAKGDHNATVSAVLQSSSGGIIVVPQNVLWNTTGTGCGTTVEGNLLYSNPVGGASTYQNQTFEVGSSFPVATGWTIDFDGPPSSSNHNFVITGIPVDPNAPPIASASAVNLSASGRADKTNYLGDKWQLTDTSVTAAVSPLDMIEWDFNLPGGQAASIFFDLVLRFGIGFYSQGRQLTGYFPCDPSGSPAGDYSAGGNCWASVGSPTTTASYYFGMHTHNGGQANKWSDTPPVLPFVSPAISVAPPQINIVGLSGGILRILSGGTAHADASGSQGNISDPLTVFNWTFTPSGNSNSQSPIVPIGATAFSLTITYPDGYLATASGTIQQVDLVPAFSLTPNPVINGGQLILTNQMQKGATTTLNSVDYQILPGGSLTTINCPNPFCNVNGTTNVTAPATTGSYTMTLTYHFTGPAGTGNLPVTLPFSTTSFTPAPLLNVYSDLHITGLPFFGLFNLTLGNTYYLYDDETLPQSVTHPGADFYFSTNSSQSVAGDQSLGHSTGYGPSNAYTPQSTCTTCYLKLVVSGVVAVSPIRVSNTPPPTPTPPPSGISVSLFGPTGGTAGTGVTFTAVASGGTGAYSYTWDWGASPFPTFAAGPATNSHVYSTASTYTVTVRATDGSSTGTATAFITIVPGGPPPPSANATVSGAPVNPLTGIYTAEAGKTITFSALEIPANVAGASGYTWDFADGSPKHGQQVTYSFTGTGSRAVGLTVAGDGVNRAGTASTLIRFNVTPPSFQALLVPSAEHSAVFPDPSGELKFWATDVSIVNQGSSPVTVSPAFLSFTTTQTPAFDLSTVAFDPSKKVTIPAKGIWSAVDIVKMLAGDGASKGTLVFKYEGGDATPLVTSRVYFAPASDPLGPSAGSAIPSVKATQDGQVVSQSTQAAIEQDLPGLRGDAAYYFRVTLFNSASMAGVFRLSAVDDQGNPVTMLDPRNGTPSSFVDFPIGPYQAVDWANSDLGLNDPAKRYVLKARRSPVSSTGRLIASAASRDRFTRDQVLITSDVAPELRENCTPSTIQQCVIYRVPGASRFQSPSGARWRTGLSIYNPSQTPRGVGLEYRYQDTSLANPESVVKDLYALVAPGRLIYFDDVVAQVFGAADATLADPANGTAGVLTILHFADSETSTSPLIISARNYDDQPTGTVGSQLAVYTRPISVGAGEPGLLLAGLQADATDGSNPKPRFETIVSVFAYDDVQTVVRLTSLQADGTVLGSHDLALNQAGASGHFQPRNLNLPEFNSVINQPVTIKVEVVSGGRVGAYALVRDITTRDPTYVQALPQ